MIFGVIGNTTKESLADAVASLLSLAPQWDLRFLLHDELRPVLQNSPTAAAFVSAEELVAKSDCLIALGGDGTILTAARMVGRSGVPILGVNLGKLGFMAEVSPADVPAAIQEIVEGTHRIEERMVLQGKAEQDTTKFFALNDIVIDNGRSSRLINISVFVDDEFLVGYAGDGVILSTPTGSTAYALAAGGPIVVPTTGVIIVQPVSPHSLSARTVIVPEASRVRVTVEHHTNEARVTADGHLQSSCVPPLSVTVTKAAHTVRLVKRKESSYYDVLHTKLFWGSDLRVNKKGNV